MAEITAIFDTLLEAFHIAPAPTTAFFLKMEHAENFVHVETEIDEMIGVGFASFTSYQGTFDGYDSHPTYRLEINATLRDGELYLRATNGLVRVEDDETPVAVAIASNWRDLGRLLKDYEKQKATFFQISCLFRQIAEKEAFTLSSKFKLYERELVAA